MLWAHDGDPDTFRIKIWYENGGEIGIYDNGVGQTLGGGSIVVHVPKKVGAAFLAGCTARDSSCSHCLQNPHDQRHDDAGRGKAEYHAGKEPVPPPIVGQQRLVIVLGHVVVTIHSQEPL